MRRISTLTLSAIVVVAVLAVAIALWWMPRAEPLEYRGANVLLISIDTIRADRIGSYGYANAETPRLDRLAREGVRFEQVVSPMPLTLPAHTSLFTALFPPQHGVRDNGLFEISADATTLAEQLEAVGYDCGAFIGAFVLHSRWGLDRGFSTYNEDFEYGQPSAIQGQVERPAEAVIAAALPWMKAERESPCFAWVHLYDPHSPYAAPEPWGARYEQRPYDGEVAYTDDQIGMLLDELEGAGLLENTIVIVTGDHGEGLGDHEEPGHGMFLYDTTLLVPLFIRLPDLQLAGREVAEQVRLIDIAPTVLELVGVPPAEQFFGLSLVPYFEGQPGGRVAYAETFYPRWYYGWQELYAVRQDGFKYILAPKAELYMVSADPGEIQNLLEQQPGRAAALRAEIEELRGDGDVAGPGQLSPEAERQLRSLGYIGSAPADIDPGEELPDPKDKIGMFKLTTQAHSKLVSGNAAEAVELFREVIAEDPRIVSAHHSLGNALFKLRRFAEAAEAFQATLELNPDGLLALANLGLAHRRMGDTETARADLEALLLMDPENPTAHLNLGEMALEAERPADALAHFEDGMEGNAELPTMRFGLGVAAFQAGDIDRGETILEELAAEHPNFPEVHYYLALIADERGDPAAAAELYRTEVGHNPMHHRSWFNLGQLLAEDRNHAEAVTNFENAIEVNPNLGPAYVFLGRSLLALGDASRLAEAEAAARSGLSLELPQQLVSLAHYILADVYNRLGRPDDAQREAGLARAAERGVIR